MFSSLDLLTATRWFGRLITLGLIAAIVVMITNVARADDEDPRKPSLYVPGWQSPATPPPPPVAWTIENGMAVIWAERLPFQNCDDVIDLHSVSYNIKTKVVTVACYGESASLPPLPEGVEGFTIRRSTMVMK